MISATAQRTVAAPPQLVADTLLDVASWPRWQPDVSMASAGGPVAEGHTFEWKAKGMRIESTIEALDRARFVRWRGRAPGTRALHAWRFEADAGGGTRVSTEESMDGWMTRLPFMGRMLERTLETTLDALAAEAERREAA